jgi:long-chain acyl-CoA synthetase
MSVYDQRPWLQAYDEGLPAEIAGEHESALAMFRASVQRAPHSPALHYFTSTLSFRQVDELSDALSAALQDLGVAPGDRVAVYLQNVPQFLIAMVATWKVSATLVSANAMLKGKELKLLLQDSGAMALVTLESLWREVARETVQDTGVRVAVTTSPLDWLDGETPPVLADCERERDELTHDLLGLTRAYAGRRADAPAPRAGDIAFLTYTSGTTGPAKGAMNTHGNVVFNAHAYQRWARLTSDDVVMGIAPLFHITGLVGHLAVAMLVGMPVVLQYRFTPATALELIEHHRATFTIAAITAYIALMNEPTADRYDVSSFRKLYTGGAPVAPPVVEAFERRFGGYIHNVYGLTETTSPTHAVPMDARAPVDPTSGALSVGVPVFNTMARVIGADGQEVGAGEVGEIELAGPQVVPGYWQKPEETEHAFPGGALRTGDVGFMDEHGWFYIVDRMKDQINAAGFKIWPREVEDVLYEHPAVRECAVVGAPDEYRGETVKAFVSLRRGEEVTAEQLVAFCQERMAAYKYPRQVEVLAELPKTETGKILRRELRDREWRRPAAGDTTA